MAKDTEPKSILSRLRNGAAAWISGAGQDPPKRFTPVAGATVRNASDTRGVQPLAPPDERKAGNGQSPIRGLAGARVSQENPDQFFTGLEAFAVFSNRGYWKKYVTADQIKLSDFSQLDTNQLVELLADLSPELSDALWKYLLMANPGWEIRAIKPGTDEPDEAAQPYLDQVMGTIGKNNGTTDVFFNRMFMTIALRGSILAELITDERGREVVDIATPDTRTLKYRRRNDPLRGTVWTFGQMQQGEFVSLELETVRYAPLHPFPNSIEGRPLFTSSFFLTIFLMAVLRDFKRVIQQQGYPRLDVEIDFEKIRESMPTEAQNDPAKFEEWVNGIVSQVVGVYNKLEPDQTYVHTTVTKVNAPQGAVNTSSLAAMDGLFKALERMAARALHTMPLLMGITDGVSEANANRQWEIYAKGIESIQHLVENVLRPILELGLQAKGILTSVELRFAQMRAAEKLRDAQVEFLETQTAVIQRNEGFISQDQAAQKAAKVKAAFLDKPLYEPPQANAGGDDVPAGQGTGEQTDNRALQNLWNMTPEKRARLLSSIDEMFRTPTVGEVSALTAIWNTHAPDDAAALISATVESGRREQSS